MFTSKKTAEDLKSLIGRLTTDSFRYRSFRCISKFSRGRVCALIWNTCRKLCLSDVVTHIKLGGS